MHKRPLKKLLCAVVAAVGLGAGLNASAADPLKVGFVYIGPIGDHGWTYQHEQGRKELAAKFGEQITTNYVENVPEGADAERVIRNMAKDKYDLIFTTSFGYMNPTLKVAKQFPKVTFEHATGYKQDKNLGTYLARTYEGRYVGGFIAADRHVDLHHKCNLSSCAAIRSRSAVCRLASSRSFERCGPLMPQTRMARIATIHGARCVQTLMRSAVCIEALLGASNTEYSTSQSYLLQAIPRNISP